MFNQSKIKLAQAQQLVFIYSYPERFVIFKFTNSSAMVGCIPIVLSKSFLVIPLL